MLLFIFWKNIQIFHLISACDLKMFWKNFIINTSEKMANVAEWHTHGRFGSMEVWVLILSCANIQPGKISQSKVHCKCGLTGIKWAHLGPVRAPERLVLHWLWKMTAIKQIFCWQEPPGGVYHSHPPSWLQETAHVSLQPPPCLQAQNHHRYGGWTEDAFKSNRPRESCKTPLLFRTPASNYQQSLTQSGTAPLFF